MRECEGLDKACTGSMIVTGHALGFGQIVCKKWERKRCGLDLVYTLFVGSFYTVDLSQSRVGSCVYAWVTVAIRFLYKHCMLVLSIQCVGSLCNWIFSSTGCGVLLCSLLGLCIRISLLSNMLDLCVYAWVTKQHTYIIHI